MKFTTAACFLLTLESADAFSPSFIPKKHTSSFLGSSAVVSLPSAPSTSTMTMLVETSGGMMELEELTEAADKANVLSKRVRKSPSFFKLAGLASIPVSAALGFGIVPSRRLAAHAVGGIVTGIAGAVGKTKLDAITEATAKPAIAQAIIDAGIDDPNAAARAVQNVKDAFGLIDEDFDTICTEIYATYLTGMVKYNPVAKTSELKELESIKNILQLDNLQVGEAHAAAAKDWYRQVLLTTEEDELDDPDHPDRKALDKLIFLTERALRQAGETDEAFAFEMTRVAKALGVDFSTAMERVAETVEPFYQRALKSTRSKLGSNQVSSDMLERARRTLGISEEMAADMHVNAFNDEVRSLLGLEEDAETVDMSNAVFPDDAEEKLDQLREILGLSETDADYEITAEATPLYQTTALAAMKDVLSGATSPDKAWSIMENRRQELLLKESSSKTLVSSMVMQALGGPLEECQRFAKVNNEAATYDNLLDAIEAKNTLIAILAKSGWDEYDKFDEIFCNPWDKQSANGFLVSDERTAMYRIFLTRAYRKSEDGKLSDEACDQIRQVQGLLGITDQQAEIEARRAFGPLLQKVLQKATMEIVEDYTEELVKNMKAEIDEVMGNLKLSKVFLQETGASFYSKAVALVSENSPSGIPTKDQQKALEALQEMFGLNIEDTFASHMEYFGSVYKKSILEAMGSTGVIRPELQESLNDLQERLGVSTDDCRSLFLEAVEEKMTPMVEWIGSEMERTMLTQKQLSQRRGKDMGEDLFQTGKGANGVLGLGAEVNIMSDIMELIDFYNENEIAEESDDGESKIYPVTALGSGAIDQEMAELLYRQFVVGGFTAQGPQAERYESSRATFAGIIGLDQSKIDEIGNNIGSTVYDNFVSNAMKTKGTMDQQDMMFLANIQGKLGISEEEGEKMLSQAQTKILSEEANLLMDDPTPAKVKAFREKCNGMGVDLNEDVGMSKQRLTRMFEAEITPSLKSGKLTVDSFDLVTEVTESLGLEAEDAEAAFESLISRLTTNAMNLIKGEIMRGREENAVEPIKELVNYARFTDGDLGVEVDESTAHKIFNVYDALDFDGVDEDKVEEDKQLLKSVLSL